MRNLCTVLPIALIAACVAQPDFLALQGNVHEESKAKQNIE